MAYTRPAFMVSHPISDLPDVDAAITTADGSLTLDGKRAISDRRQAYQATWTLTGPAPAIDFDLGESADLPIDRLVIPEGHTIGEGQTLTVWSSPDQIGPPTNRGSTGPLVGDGALIDLPLTEASVRYWRIELSGGTGPFRLGEVWLGNYRQLSAQVPVDPDQDYEYEYSVFEESFGGGTASLEYAPPRRKFSLASSWMDPASEDYAIYEDVLRRGRSRALWYWPPDDGIGGPYLVKVTRSAVRSQDFPAPLNQTSYSVSLEMVEQLA